MIKNDPFKTREESLKTLLRINSDETLLHFVREMNPGNASTNNLMKYFLGLYKEYPNEFSLRKEKRLHLMFMNHCVTSFMSSKAFYECVDVDKFFKFWKEINLIQDAHAQE